MGAVREPSAGGAAVTDDRTRVGALDKEAGAHERGCSACRERFVALVHRPERPEHWWVESPQYCPRCGRQVTAGQ